MINNTHLLRLAKDIKGKVINEIGPEGLLQLAKEGVIPHYVITNPITSESSVYFHASEVEFYGWHVHKCKIFVKPKQYFKE